MVSSQSRNSAPNIGRSQGIVKTIWQSRRARPPRGTGRSDDPRFIDTADRGWIPSAENRRGVPLQPLVSSPAARESLRQMLASSELRGVSLMKSIEDAGRRHDVEPFALCLELFSRAARSEPDARITFE